MNWLLGVVFFPVSLHLMMEQEPHFSLHWLLEKVRCWSAIALWVLMLHCLVRESKESFLSGRHRVVGLSLKHSSAFPQNGLRLPHY